MNLRTHPTKNEGIIASKVLSAVTRPISGSGGIWPRSSDSMGAPPMSLAMNTAAGSRRDQTRSSASHCASGLRHRPVSSWSYRSGVGLLTPSNHYTGFTR